MDGLKYEYKVTYFQYADQISATPGADELGILEKHLNKDGDKGWELVAIDFDKSLFYYKKLKKSS